MPINLTEPGTFKSRLVCGDAVRTPLTSSDHHRELPSSKIPTSRMSYLLRVRAILGLSLIAVSLSAGCDPAIGKSTSTSPPKSATSLADMPRIKVAFTRSVNMQRQPLMDHLTGDMPFIAVALLNRQSEITVGMLEERFAAAAQLEVVSYLEAQRQFGVVPLAKPLNRDGEPISYSVFVTRKDSPLRSLGDLRGRSLALGSFHSTLSNLIPRHELIQAGVKPEQLATIEHFDNDEAVVRAVLEGRFDAGAVKDLVASREQDLRALHVSDPVPSAPIVVRENLSRGVTQTIRDALLKIDFQDAKDREHWQEDIRFGFAPATDADYEPVRQIMKTSPTGCEGACHGRM